MVGPVEILHPKSDLCFNLLQGENKEQANQNLGWYDIINDISLLLLCQGAEDSHTWDTGRRIQNKQQGSAGGSVGTNPPLQSCSSSI